MENREGYKDMEKRQFEDIREKLYDVEIPVDADIWGAIEGSMRRRRVRRIFLYASSAAAVLVAALLLFVSSPKEPDTSLMVANNIAQTGGPVEDSPAAAVPAADTAPMADAVSSSASGTVSTLPQTGGQAAAHKATEGSHIAAADTHKAAQEALKVAEEAHKAATEKAETKTGITDKTKNIAGNPYRDTDKAAVAQEAAPAANEAERRSHGYGKAEGLYEVEETRKGRGYAVRLSSGVMPGSSASVSGGIINASSAGAGSLSQSYTIEQISDTRYSLPLNLGVQFQFPIGENMALGVGFNYTMLRSRYDCLINKKKFDVKQTLHYIGIPVNVYGTVAQRNNFRFYLNAGAALEKGLRAVYDLKSYDQTEHNSSSIDGVQFSVNAGLGVEYILGNTTGLYLEPNIVYYIDSDVPQSIRTDQPLQVKAELGFRFRF